MSKAFASQADLDDKKITFEQLSPHCWAYTAEGDPNSGVIIGEKFIMVSDATATPAMARDLIARILLNQGPAVLSANQAAWNMDEQKVSVFGPLVFVAADGYRLTTSDVDVDLQEQKLVSRGRVEGSVPAGTFSADRIVTDLQARTVTLEGNARLRMTPGRLKMP